MKTAFIIILIHFVADFILQTDSQAKGKSKSWKWLLLHTSSYSIVWAFVGVMVFPENQFLYVFYFTLITFIAHTITDYFTSRLNSRLWGAGKVHKFFVSVGFDQVLHYGQLFLTFHFLTM